jgi:hypothetical protein
MIKFNFEFNTTDNMVYNSKSCMFDIIRANIINSINLCFTMNDICFWKCTKRSDNFVVLIRDNPSGWLLNIDYRLNRDSYQKNKIHY